MLSTQRWDDAYGFRGGGELTAALLCVVGRTGFAEDAEGFEAGGRDGGSSISSCWYAAVALGLYIGSYVETIMEVEKQQFVKENRLPRCHVSRNHVAPPRDKLRELLMELHKKT